MQDSTTLTVFEFEGKTFQIIDHHGDPWFIGKEICDALGFANHRDALSNLSDHQRDYVAISDAIGRSRETSIISESGLYKLAFRSRRPEAERFTNKVVDEILPAIRKTGSYSVGHEPLDPTEPASIMVDLETVQQEKAKSAAQESFWHYRTVYLGKIERRLLQPAPPPKTSEPKPLKLIHSPETFEDVLMDVITTKIPRGEKATARTIMLKGSTFLRTAGTVRVREALNAFHDQGRLVKEGDGKYALYGLPSELHIDIS